MTSINPIYFKAHYFILSITKDIFQKRIICGFLLQIDILFMSISISIFDVAVFKRPIDWISKTSGINVYDRKTSEFSIIHNQQNRMQTPYIYNRYPVVKPKDTDQRLLKSRILLSFHLPQAVINYQ